MYSFTLEPESKPNLKTVDADLQTERTIPLNYEMKEFNMQGENEFLNKGNAYLSLLEGLSPGESVSDHPKANVITHTAGQYRIRHCCCTISARSSHINAMH